MRDHGGGGHGCEAMEVVAQDARPWRRGEAVEEVVREARSWRICWHRAVSIGAVEDIEV